MKKVMAITMLLIINCCYIIGAEEAVEAAKPNPWMPVIGELASLFIQVVGPILVLLISAAVWKLLGKIGIEKNVAIDSLMRTYIKQGINFADSWASSQKDKPAGEQKMATAIKHILGLIADSKLPTIAEEKLMEKIEAQLAFDKKSPAPSDTKVING